MYKQIVKSKVWVIVIAILSALLLHGAVGALGDSSVKYQDPYLPNNSITFYPEDGTFFIEQSVGHDLAGTYIETPEAYGITYSGSPFGENLIKTEKGILVPNGEWIKV